MIEGRYKKYSNRFFVNQIFLPTLAPQSKFNCNFVNEDGVSLNDKKILVASEPTIERLIEIKQILKNTFSKSIRSIVGLIVVGGLEMKT